MPRAIVLVNPRSRSGARAPIGRILDAFNALDWDAELWAGDGRNWTAEATARACDLGVAAVFGAGGDGLLSQMLPPLLNTEVALGVVPLGTGNVWARELGLPLQPERAIAAQLSGSPRRVDVGFANGHPFLVIASVGWDARIVAMVEADPNTKALGQLAYPLAGMALTPGMHGVASRVWLDDSPPVDLDLLAGMITNGRLYGGVVSLVPAAQVADGLLNVVLFPGSGLFEITAHAARVLTGLHQGDERVLMRPVRRIRIETLGESLPVQTDGDLLGTTPLTVEVGAGALLALGAGTGGYR